MRILIASDHAGFELKAKLHAYLRKLHYDVTDQGPHELDLQDDYPDYVAPVASEVSTSQGETVGIVIGASGQGEAIAANRFSNIRAVVYYGGTLDIIKLSREHNNANILSLGARFLSEEGAQTVVKIWLETPFSGEERHVRRIGKIETLGTRL